MDEGSTQDGGGVLSGNMAFPPDCGQPAGDVDATTAESALTAEWALWGREASGSAPRVLRCSVGTFTRRDFSDVITRYASGVKERLPQYTVCWIPGEHGGSSYLGLAVHELADPDPVRSGGRSRVVGGQEVEYVRLFCVPYEEMAEFGVGYADLAELVREYQLPAGSTEPIPLWWRPGRRPRRRSWLRPLAENVAALLLTTRPVCVLGAQQATVEDRLGFIELVMSLLPYGLRSRLSASTWASSTAQELKLRLFFASAERDDRTTSYVTWGKAQPPLLSGQHEPIRQYLEWLRRPGVAAEPALAALRTPMRFSDEDIGSFFRDLPRGRSVIEALEELADMIRSGDREGGVPLAVGGLGQLMRSALSPADRAASRAVIFRRGLLSDLGNLDPETTLTLYRLLLRIAVDTPVTYDDYCGLEGAVGGPPRGALGAVVRPLPFSSFIPWLLAAKEEPAARDKKLMAELRVRQVAPTTPIDEVARLGDKIRPEHRAIVYDFAARYLRTASDPVLELRRRGYLAEVLAALFPGDVEAQRTRLTDTVRFIYRGPLSQSEINDLLDVGVAPTTALKQAVRGLTRSARKRRLP